jgi:hypothetical protein
MLVSCFFDPEDGGNIFLPKRTLTVNGLHRVISQNTELFMTMVVRTANPQVSRNWSADWKATP